MDMTFKGFARRLDDLDLPRLGASIGVGRDEIHAFLHVETSGHGFDAQGRPVILFEPHVFYRNLAGAARAKAVAAGLAYAKWGEKPYPRDSYPRLKAACAIDETAALRSASWGLGQVLGENFRAAGFPTVQAMVEARWRTRRCSWRRRSISSPPTGSTANCASMTGPASPRATTAHPTGRTPTISGLPRHSANGPGSGTRRPLRRRFRSRSRRNRTVRRPPRQSRAKPECGADRFPDRCPDYGPQCWLRWSPQSSPCFERPPPCFERQSHELVQGVIAADLLRPRAVAQGAEPRAKLRVRHDLCEDAACQLAQSSRQPQRS